MKSLIVAKDSVHVEVKEKVSPAQTAKKKVYHGGWWGKVYYDGKPWVQNASMPHKLSSALHGKHISLWASHGRYFERNGNEWRWQRPYFFCTTEDLFTQTIVVPYLIPMLENAGAIVFTPRERDWQTEEVIVDNGSSGYFETTSSDSVLASDPSDRSASKWSDCDIPGFAMPSGNITDGYNPFMHGTVRQVQATDKEFADSAIYQPTFRKSGRYAVYVSYATLPNSIDNVMYSVYHQGQRTDFRVNQQMGGGTWVYLGTFCFDQGTDINNRVVVSARSGSKGMVTTDAVRFGGGMGNVGRDKTNTLANRIFLHSLDTLKLPCDTLRDSLHLALHDSIISAKRDSVQAIMSSAQPKVSGMPRCLEGARYYAQWAGVPDSVYSVYNSTDDYKDDINSRSLMENWLAGGSPYVPDRHGKGVPIDLSLAIHSDAGYNRDMKSIYGSLAICTTQFGDSLLAADLPRSHSRDFAQMLLDQSKKDLTAAFGWLQSPSNVWTWRSLYDRNYSETRLPTMPSAIFEMLSHQSFPDMKLAQDPNFKFTMARSIYKTILRYEAEAHGEKVIVQPLAPICLSMRAERDSILTLSWKPQQDSTEITAGPLSYNVYTAISRSGFDNGRNIKPCRYTLHLKRDQMYRFRVTAVNGGGESFPSEELSVAWHSPKAKNILVVNGFTRLASPAVIDDHGRKGFDIEEDPGVSYGMTAGWSGKQKVFSTATAGHEGPGTFGYSGNELSGHFIAGNDFNYVTEHAWAITSANDSLGSTGYNVVSCSRSAVEHGIVNLKSFDCVDIILGNEKDDGHSLMYYKTFTPELKQRLSDYQKYGHGSLLVSGSFIASDMQQADSVIQDSTITMVKNDSIFLADMLHCCFGGTVTDYNKSVTGYGQAFDVTNSLNPDHYASTKSDILLPLDSAAVVMQYSNGQPAAIATDKGFRTFAMGFPLECITEKKEQNVIMRNILQFLLK